MTTIIDEILSQSEASPIIILQGDHGPPDQYNFSDWDSLDEGEKVRLKTSILNAYHLPGGASELLWDSITPVNTLRLVFNYYLGANYEFLPDKTYYATLQHVYKFFDVTDEPEPD